MDRWWGNLCETRMEDREDEQGPAIVGYAARFYRKDDPGTEYTGLGFRERIAPGAFTRTISEDDIRGLFDHDSSKILGRTGAGTMHLALDNRGLKYTIPYDENDQDHRNVKHKLERGDVSGSSFGFAVREEAWTKTDDGEDVRTLLDVRLAEISVVTFPAYESSNSGLRDEDVAEIRAALQEHKREEVADHPGLVDDIRRMQRQIDDLYVRIQAR